MRLAAVLAILLAASAAAFAVCETGTLPFEAVVYGPEDSTNLWQYSTCRFWVQTRSNQVFSGQNHGRLVFNGSVWGFAENACAAWGLSAGDGSVTLVAIAEHVSGQNTAGQRAWFAVTSSLPGGTPAAPTMREVPQAAASVLGNTITITWTAVPGQPEVAGYRVVRSPNGLAGWVEIGTTTAATFQDTRTNGTWFYAVEILYTGSPVQRSSPHGLSAQVAV